jgi:hypothetical protein
MRDEDRSASDEEDEDGDCAGKVEEDRAGCNEGVKCDTGTEVEKAEEEVEGEDEKDGCDRDV